MIFNYGYSFFVFVTSFSL